MDRMRFVVAFENCVLRCRARSVSQGVEGDVLGVSGCEGRRRNDSPRARRYVITVCMYVGAA